MSIHLVPCEGTKMPLNRVKCSLFLFLHVLFAVLTCLLQLTVPRVPPFVTRHRSRKSFPAPCLCQLFYCTSTYTDLHHSFEALRFVASHDLSCVLRALEGNRRAITFSSSCRMLRSRDLSTVPLPEFLNDLSADFSSRTCRVWTHAVIELVQRR